MSLFSDFCRVPSSLCSFLGLSGPFRAILGLFPAKFELGRALFVNWELFLSSRGSSVNSCLFPVEVRAQPANGTTVTENLATCLFDDVASPEPASEGTFAKRLPGSRRISPRALLLMWRRQSPRMEGLSRDISRVEPLSGRISPCALLLTWRRQNPRMEGLSRDVSQVEPLSQRISPRALLLTWRR